MQLTVPYYSDFNVALSGYSYINAAAQHEKAALVNHMCSSLHCLMIGMMNMPMYNSGMQEL